MQTINAYFSSDTYVLSGDSAMLAEDDKVDVGLKLI
jgi:hypothetical protein